MTKLYKILQLGIIPVEPSRKRKCDYKTANVNKLEENSKEKNIWEMYKVINEEGLSTSHLCNKKR
jgi:hypothetical protein